MWAIKPHPRVRPAPQGQRGVVAIEFALVALIFFTLFFGMVELARAMYICNTLQEVTRRAAALAVHTDFTNGAALQQVREQAVFRTSPGLLAFAEPVTDAHVKIDYLRIQRDGSSLSMVPIASASLPASPAANYVNCVRDPNGADPSSGACIRLVRARICAPGAADECAPVKYQSLVALVALSFNLPSAVTIANAETLGMPEGLPPEPCGCQ